MAELHLAGCRSRPLIGYLKALGLLRVVSRQADRSSRGRWRDGVFELRCELDEQQLASFLLEAYAPSPVVSPWNGGSGFHPKDRKDAIVTLERSVDPRFASYRKAIQATRTALAHLNVTDKPEPAVKPQLVRELRRRLPDEALPWLDAAIVVTGEEVSYPPLLGSGGNDGRYDFSNNYAQAVVHCLLSDQRGDGADDALSAAIGDGVTQLQRKLSLGHLRRDASPTNSPYGEADSLGNPWDLILAVEGTLLLVAGAARRHGAAISGGLVAPFTVYATAAGYNSAAAGEGGRAELWLPLWPGWATAPEIENLARESRAQVGRGSWRRQARTGLDFARAAGELGVARGIEAFERYAILERAGQSSLAVPTGRVSVSERPGAEAVRSIGPWLDNVLRFGKGDSCPTAIRAAARRLEQICFRLAARASSKDACNSKDACDALEAIGEMEHILARSHSVIASGLRPLHARAEAWIKAADDGSPEFAVAAALASLRDRQSRSPALRDYLHGTETATQQNRINFDPERRHIVHGSSPVQLLAAIHARRHLDAKPAREDRSETDDRQLHHVRERPQDEDTHTTDLGLAFDQGTWCDIRVARLFAAGRLDNDRVLRLLWGLALLDYRFHTPTSHSFPNGGVAMPVFDVLALAWMGRSLPSAEAQEDHGPHTRQTTFDSQQHLQQGIDRQDLGPRSGWAARLASGAVEAVTQDALLRLRMAGLEPIHTAGDLLDGTPRASHFGQRLGAALLIPLRPTDLARVVRSIIVPKQLQANDHQTEEIS